MFPCHQADTYFTVTDSLITIAPEQTMIDHPQHSNRGQPGAPNKGSMSDVAISIHQHIDGDRKSWSAPFVRDGFRENKLVAPGSACILASEAQA